jgi:hypothetical protein
MAGEIGEAGVCHHVCAAWRRTVAGVTDAIVIRFTWFVRSAISRDQSSISPDIDSVCGVGVRLEDDG